MDVFDARHPQQAAEPLKTWAHKINELSALMFSDELLRFYENATSIDGIGNWPKRTAKMIAGAKATLARFDVAGLHPHYDWNTNRQWRRDME